MTAISVSADAVGIVKRTMEKEARESQPLHPIQVEGIDALFTAAG